MKWYVVRGIWISLSNKNAAERRFWDSHGAKARYVDVGLLYISRILAPKNQTSNTDGNDTEWPRHFSANSAWQTGKWFLWYICPNAVNFTLTHLDSVKEQWISQHVAHPSPMTVTHSNSFDLSLLDAYLSCEGRKSCK